MFEMTKSDSQRPACSGQTATEKPLVSAIIPTHNRAVLLERAIRSVQHQTYPHLEIIVVDDASQDNTDEVVESFGDPRIRYIRHDNNRGGSAARNTGIAAATGEFIAFLDDDDEWEPKKTEEQLKALKHYDVVVCTDGVGTVLSRYRSNKTIELADLRDGPWGGTGVLMARTKIVKQMMFDESLPRGQDWDLFIRIALKHKIGYLNKPLLLRHDSGAHPGITNSVRNIPVNELEQQFSVVDKYKELFGMSWFKRQMCKGLLYGIKHRPNKMTHLVFTARKYGVFNVTCALGNRLRAILSRKLRHVRSTTR